MELNNNLCSVCHINEHKYKCPACSTRTCSLECIKRHKNQMDCTGVIDQTKFISKKNLASDIVHINRDYNFLLKVDRNLKVGKEDIKSNAKNVFKRPNQGQQRGSNKRIRAGEKNDEDPRLKKVYQIYTHEPNTVTKRQNTLIIQVSPGMSRSTSNKTGYDKKSASFTWTIEWVLIGEDDNVIMKFLSYRLKERLILEDAIPLNILNSNKIGKEIQKDNLKFYLNNVVHSGKMKHSFIKLQNDLSIADNLKDKIVLEYPTVFVTLNDTTWKEFAVSEQSAYEYLNQDSNTDTDTDSDTDSTSDSDEETESGSEADSTVAANNALNDTSSRMNSIVDAQHTADKVETDDNEDDSAPEEASSKEPKVMKFGD